MVDLTNSSSKKGALDALTLLLASKNRKIKVKPDDKQEQEKQGLAMPKNIEIVGDDKEGTESEEEKKDRLDRIEAENSEDNIQKDISDIKTDVDLKKAAAQRANKAEFDKIAQQGQLMDFSAFSADLFRAVRSQISLSKNPEDSYSKINPTYAGSDLLMPGQARVDKKEVPVIQVYFDQSSSWGSDDLKRGMNAITSLDQFKRRGKIKVQLFFFSEHLHTDPDDCAYEGNTAGFPEVLSNIAATHATNVIVMTDSDIENQTNWSRQPTVEVKGCVWWLWRYGDKSRTAPKHLIGRKGNYQYKL